MQNPHCPDCNSTTKKYGKDKLGNQRFYCNSCQKAFIPNKKEIRLEKSKTLRCLNLLVEGNSIRATERVTDVHRDTILHLLNVVGGHCQKLMDEKIVNIPLERIEADEI